MTSSSIEETRAVPDPLFIALDQEWRRLSTGPRAHSTVRSWSRDEVELAQFPDLDAVVAAAHNRNAATSISGVLGALVRLANADQMAARTLLQALMPGLRRLVRELDDGTGDTAAAVVTSAWERIRCYPRSRKGSVAANVLFDTRRAVLQEVADRRRLLAVPLTDSVAEATPTADSDDPAGRLLHLLREAVLEGRLSRRDARLIVLTRIGSVPLKQLAREQRCPAQTLRRRRQRAETRLREAR